MKLKDILSEGEVIEFPPAKSKKELDRLLATKIHGNFKDDHQLWDDLEDFITNDKNLMSHRVKALKKLDQLLGQVQPSYNSKMVDKYVKSLNQEAKEMYESNELVEGLTISGKERVERAVRIFTNIMKDTPDANVENSKKAAIKMAHIEIYSGAEMNKVEEELEKVLENIKKKK